MVYLKQMPPKTNPTTTTTDDELITNQGGTKFVNTNLVKINNHQGQPE